MSYWYEVIGQEGHYGAGRYNEVKLYIRANSIPHLLKLYRKVGGMKYGAVNYNRRRFNKNSGIPTARILSIDEVVELKLNERLKKEMQKRGSKKLFYLRG